ncbi:phosphoenolpyruvate synthase [Candidatus Shapirobacteria bacterium]|nr:phosphoenolpyruvate synthase [Candidatus Shapirobacteria bacterium]
MLWFDEVDKEDIPLVGGKGANLGELTKIGAPVPPGFIVTAAAYFYFLKENNLEEKIRALLREVSPSKPESYQEVAEKIQKLIISSPMPKDLAVQIMKAYLKLGKGINEPLVAVRSSATAEDLPEASFAGQQRTFLNIRGEANVVNSVHRCWASLFEGRGIFYREEHGFDHLKVGLAAPVQKMVQSDASGVIFTADPTGQRKNIILLEAVWGLGELIVQGEVIPDLYLVDFKTLKILEKETHPQRIQLIKKGEKTVKVLVPKGKIKKPKLTNAEIKKLAKIAKKVHEHYFFPQDLEWAREKGKFYLVQTRPITTLDKKKAIKGAETEQKITTKPLIIGIPASPGIGVGPVRKVKSLKEINKVRKGDILVTPMTSPDFVPAMKLAVAIVTDQGGITSHAAIVSRELGIPCVVGTRNATRKLKDNQLIIVDGKEGKIFSAKKSDVEVFAKAEAAKALKLEDDNDPKIKTATKLYVNLGEPDLAEEIARKNVEGVGLLRAEFMFAQIGIHPQLLIKQKKEKELVEKLASGMEKFCQAFYPRPVVYRTNDFKTNEYRHLRGGEKFEEEEENPLLGFRGVSRYLVNEAVFKLEAEAIRTVRNKRGLKNLWVMLPFVRTPEELREAKKLLASFGLIRSPSFKLWLMVEIPSNVILLEDFIKLGIDGVSVGTNDLTMLLLGIDRDNPRVAHLYNEEDPAVLWALERTIKTCQKNKITSSICGQAPSDSLSLVKKLVRWGITSISANPDAIGKVRQAIIEAEKEAVKK